MQLMINQNPCLNFQNFISDNHTRNMKFLSNNYSRAFKRLIKILLILFYISVSYVQCQSNEESTIKILGEVYLSLPQISDEGYSIVNKAMTTTIHTVVTPIESRTSSINLSSPSHRFQAKKQSDYFVTQAANTTHQAAKFNFIKGRNIFTPEYIKLQVLELSQELLNKSRDQVTIERSKEQSDQGFKESKQKVIFKQKNTEQTSGLQGVKQDSLRQREIEKDKKSQFRSQQTLADKTSQIYREFKNIDVLKEKNLRANGIDSEQQEKNQNIQKLVGYIVIGVVLSFGILKRVTKSSQPSLPKSSLERTELRLKDSADEDDEDEDSDDSNE